MEPSGIQKSIAKLAGAASLVVPGSFALAGEVTPAPQENYPARLAQLENEVAQLRTNGGASWLRAEQAEEIRALVAETRDDARQRTSLRAGGGNAGWDKHFHLASADGAFTIKLSAQVQTRAVWNTRDNSGDDNSLFGFEMRRVKVGASGTLFNSDFSYKVRGAVNRKTGAFELEDAWGAYKLNDTTKIKWGQYKAPFLREELISSTRQLAVDRSYVTELATQNFTQGVALNWQQDQLRATAMLGDGWGISFTGDNAAGSNTAFAADGTELAFTGRVEYLAAGDDFKQFKDYTSWNDDEFGVLIGAAAHYQKEEREDGPPDTDTDVLAWTIDASAEFGGAHVEGYLVGQSSDSNTTGAADYDQIGVVVSGGFFINPDQLELFARWEYYDFDGALATGFDNTIELYTVGVNYFFNGHANKWTTDVIFAGSTIPDGSSGLGLMKDAAGQDGQVVIRTQLQFLF